MLPQLTTAFKEPLLEIERRFLDVAFLSLCVQAAVTAIDKTWPDARRLWLIPGNRTRNSFYLQNVAQLATSLELERTVPKEELLSCV